MILLVVVIALSPLISMMPSQRQRQVADLRQAAAMCGLYVKLKALPGAAPHDALWAFYGRHRQRDDAGSAQRIECSKDRGEWRVLRGTPGPDRLALLQQFPAGTERLESDIHGVGVFWNELGEPDTVRHINELLKHWLEGGGQGK